jgi:hypothetical protein
LFCLPAIECSEIESRFFSTIFDVWIGAVLKKHTDRIQMTELGGRMKSGLLI